MIDELKKYFGDYVRAYERQSRPERIATLLLVSFTLAASVTHTVIMWLAYG